MKIIVWVTTDRVGSKVEREIDIDDEDLKGMTKKQRQEFLDQEAHDYIMNNSMIDWGWRKA
jgi:hypothetical protein